MVGSSTPYSNPTSSLSIYSVSSTGDAAFVERFFALLSSGDGEDVHGGGGMKECDQCLRHINVADYHHHHQACSKRKVSDFQ